MEQKTAYLITGVITQTGLLQLQPLSKETKDFHRPVGMCMKTVFNSIKLLEDRQNRKRFMKTAVHM